VIVERSMSPEWLSNSYLVADREGGTAVLIDSGGPTEPLVAAAERLNVTVTHLLLTHADHDHVAGNDAYRRRFGMPVLAHAGAAERVRDLDGTLADGDLVTAGGLAIKALHTPGHSPDHLAFVVDGSDCFAGDVLFDGTVGGTMRDSYRALRRSVMEVLMKLPHETRVHPGHTDPTTIGREWERNPFVRIWRGLDPEGDERCTCFGRAARLVLFAPDYDGGHKGWVRWDDSGSDDIAPGSQVQRT